MLSPYFAYLISFLILVFIFVYLNNANQLLGFGLSG